MARRRVIDPEFWSDEEIGQWSHTARLFYIGLWNFADDEGRFKAHDNLLKSQIFPYDTKINMEKLKTELSDKVQWYVDNDLQYGFLRNFSKYQRIDRPSVSKLPAPPQFDEHSANARGMLAPKLIEVKLIEDKRREDILSGKPDLEVPIIYLNEKTKSHFDPKNKSNRELVQARFNEGRTIEQFKEVIDKKTTQWLTDEKMFKFLRPSTLFRRTNFENYLNEPTKVIETDPLKKYEVKK